MEPKIPAIVDELYRYMVTEPNPAFWPDYIKHKPILAHGMWSFYQGLQLGFQLADVCRQSED